MQNKVWVTSDWHIGHRKMTELRGFGSDVNRHDQWIIDQFNAVVHDDDYVYVLGDVIMGDFKAGIEKVKAMKGQRFLIAGNHDRIHPAYGTRDRDFEKFYDMYEAAGFDMAIGLDSLLLFGGRTFRLNHFSYEQDARHLAAGDKYAEWHPEPLEQPVGRPHWLLHGHTHSALRQSSDDWHSARCTSGLTPGTDLLVCKKC